MWSAFMLGPVSLCLLGTPSDISAVRGQHGRLLSSWRVAEVSNGPIGQCWMEDDGTIVVDLRRTADGINISMPPRRYPPTDPHYDAVLKHVGPLRPGETKLVMPWPD
jgi:hypothetical protein